MTAQTCARLALLGGHVVHYHQVDPGEHAWWACDVDGRLVSPRPLSPTDCQALLERGELINLKRLSPTATVYVWREA